MAGTVNSQTTPHTRLKVSLRPATLEDAAAITEIGITTFTATYAHSLPAHDMHAFLEKVYSLGATTADIVDPDRDIIVATAQGGSSDTPSTIIGFALLTRNSPDPCVSHLTELVEFQRLYILPEYQGHGVGKLLMGEITSMARAQGFRRMWVGAWEENFRAIAIYERDGYRKVGEREFWVGSTMQIGWIMLKELCQ